MYNLILNYSFKIKFMVFAKPQVNSLLQKNHIRIGASLLDCGQSSDQSCRRFTLLFRVTSICLNPISHRLPFISYLPARNKDNAMYFLFLEHSPSRKQYIRYFSLLVHLFLIIGSRKRKWDTEGPFPGRGCCGIGAVNSVLVACSAPVISKLTAGRCGLTGYRHLIAGWIATRVELRGLIA